jgi:Protein of unknown function (DUF3551)
MRRNISIAILAAVSAFAGLGSISPAAARQSAQDSYCLQGRQSGYPGNCQFSSYQQCQATASGTNEGCGINPMKAFAEQRRGRYPSQR